MTNTTTINAVAMALFKNPNSSYAQAKAKAAIEAYEKHTGQVQLDTKLNLSPVREMTVSDAQTILAKSMSKEAPDMEAYWYDVVEDGVRELAKLGAIRVVEDKHE